MKDEIATIKEQNDKDVHHKILEYEDLRSTMMKRHEYVLELLETIKDREFDIRKLQEEVEDLKQANKLKA